jgi:hypothetical protein
LIQFFIRPDETRRSRQVPITPLPNSRKRDPPVAPRTILMWINAPLRKSSIVLRLGYGPSIFLLNKRDNGLS